MNILGWLAAFLIALFLLTWLLIKVVQYSTSRKEYRGCIVLTYKMFKKIFRATPQNRWDIFQNKDQWKHRKYLTFRYENGDGWALTNSYICFASFLDYLRAYFFCVRYATLKSKEEKKQTEIDDTERAIAFVRSVQESLEKEFSSDMSEYEAKLNKIQKQQRTSQFDLSEIIQVIHGT